MAQSGVVDHVVKSNQVWLLAAKMNSTASQNGSHRFSATFQAVIHRLKFRAWRRPKKRSLTLA